MTRRTNHRGKAIVKNAEGLYLTAYLCPANVWTIGYGHTRGVKAGDTCTEAQAEAWLVEDLAAAEAAVARLVKVPITDNQFSALVSFCFNVGADEDTDTIAEGLGDSTLLRKLNACDYIGAANEFTKWNKGGGRILNGLVTRRLAERNLFLAND